LLQPPKCWGYRYVPPSPASVINSFCLFMFFWNNLSLCSLGWPQTCDPFVSASLVLGLQVFTLMPSSMVNSYLCIFPFLSLLDCLKMNTYSKQQKQSHPSCFRHKLLSLVPNVFFIWTLCAPLVSFTCRFYSTTQHFSHILFSFLLGPACARSSCLCKWFSLCLYILFSLFFVALIQPAGLLHRLFSWMCLSVTCLPHHIVVTAWALLQDRT
jgi:hypothetical protein